MSSSLPLPLLRIRYEKAAEEYLRSLPPEHFMEATPQSTQREITLESLALVRGKRPEVQVFNELLVQYPRGRGQRLGQVVPDNMVVVWKEPIKAFGSYDLPLQPTGPLWVLEYISKNSERKDYEESFQKYEQELQVPYCLMFYPEPQELTLFHRGKTKYRSVRANRQGRFPIPELDLEMALLDGWVRYWYLGELLPLPPELQRQLEEVQILLEETRRQLEESGRQLKDTQHKLEHERRQLEENGQQLKDTQHRLEQERQARLAAEQELAQLHVQLEQLRRQQM